MARDLNWGEDEDDAKYQTGDSSDTGGDFIVVELLGDRILLEWDDSAGEFVARGRLNIEGYDIEDDGTTIYDSGDEHVPNEIVEALANFASGDVIDAYPLEIADLDSPFSLSDLTDLDANDNDLSNVATLDTDAIENSDYTESVDTLSGSGTLTVDLSEANLIRVEATGDVTIEFSNVTDTPAGNSVLIYFVDDDDSGPHSISWPSSVVWSGGDAVDEIPDSEDIEESLVTDDGGSEWRGREGGSEFA